MRPNSTGSDSSRNLTLDVITEEAVRLDRYLLFTIQSLEDQQLSFFFGEDAALTRSAVEKLIRAGAVQVNSKQVIKPGYELRGGERLTVEFPESTPSHLEPDSSISLDILFEDRDVIVLNKPPGLTVHPGAGVSSGTLVNALLSHLGDEIRMIGDSLRPGIVHRLDKDTSGVMVVAKNGASFQALAAQFLPPRSVHRIYHGLTFRLPDSGVRNEGVIDVPIGRDPFDRVKISTRSTAARSATTHWKKIKSAGDLHLLELQLETGRTHQIRVHLQHARSPLLGDPVYGTPTGQLPEDIRKISGLINRQALHAHELSFLHPRSGERVAFVAKYADDFSALYQAIFGDKS